MADERKYIDVSDLDRFQALLERFDLSDAQSVAAKKARRAIANALKKAAEAAEEHIGQKIPNNQRHAEKGVRSRSYSKKSGVLGGMLTILRGKAARNGASAMRIPPPTKSGRRREWSARTKQMYGYTGADAQFILYWLSQGTAERQAGVGRRDRNGNYGTRSTGSARDKYFAGTHSVGFIGKKFDPALVPILENIVNNELIPELDKIWSETNK